jgi:hypothetical protein
MMEFCQFVALVVYSLAGWLDALNGWMILVVFLAGRALRPCRQLSIIVSV